MLNISGLDNGIVLDHIPAGMSMEIYKYLNLGKLDSQVAIIKNASSKKMGKKDIIKISDAFEVNFDVLGYIDPEVTVCVIENGSVKSKHKVELPEKIVNIAKCKNPRCITSVEQEIDHVFKLPAFQILLSYERQFRFRPLATPLAAYAFLLEQIFGCFRSEYRRPNAG